MRKNRMMRLASILLVCVLLTTSVISGTYAKYTTSSSAITSSATVAKWDVKLDGNAFSQTTTFDFFETWTDSDGGTEEHVKTKTLAPGTKGSFNFQVTNSSDVAAQFKIDFDLSAVESLPLVITYKVGDATYTDDQFVAIAMNESKTVTVNWEWPFERGETANGKVNKNAADTALGLAAGTFGVSATVTIEQVD